MAALISAQFAVLDAAVKADPNRLPFWDAFPEGYEDWKQHWSPWDVVELGGRALPGLGSVKGAAQHRIEVQKVNGKDGAALIERGYTPGELDIDLLMWTPEQWKAFLFHLPFLYRRANKLDYQDAAKKPKTSAQTAAITATEKRALSLRHPAAQLIGINAVIVQSVAVPVNGPVAGTKLVVFKCTEYVAPTATAEASNALRSVAGVNPGPIDARVENPTRNQAHRPSTTDTLPTGTVVFPSQGVK